MQLAANTPSVILASSPANTQLSMELEIASFFEGAQSESVRATMVYLSFFFCIPIIFNSLISFAGNSGGA